MRDVALAVDANAAAGHRQRAEYRLQNFGAPRADKSGDAVDFPRSNVEGHVGEALSRGQVFNLQAAAAPSLMSCFGKKLLIGLLTIARTSVSSVQSCNRLRLDAVSVTHHGHPVTTLEHFLEVVADRK